MRFDDAGTTASLGGSDGPFGSFSTSMQGFIAKVALARDDNEVTLPSGEWIGGFEVIEELGRGTFGVVLKVRDSVLGCERALKIPTTRTLEDPSLLSGFVDDARLAATIEHPNVVRVLHAVDSVDARYIVMEYCPDGSLSEWLRRRQGKPVPAKWAARIAAQIADGVDEAHARKILHRDLKPANILLVRVGADDGADPPAFCPKVADFGVAKRLRDDGRIDESTDGLVVGTLAYMSPEQARGDPKKIDRRSDVYGVGAILFELLSGRKPYPSIDRAEVTAQILNDAPSPSLRDAWPDAPEELVVLCATAMAKDPLVRYATAAALAEDLGRFVRDEPIHGSPWWKWAMSHAMKHRRAGAVAAAAMLIVAMVGAGMFYLDARGRIEADRVKGDATTWLSQVRAADLSKLHELRLKHKPDDELVRPGLETMFREDHPGRKLSAAVMLAGLDGRCADFAVDRLLAAEPAEIRPLALALKAALPDFDARLKRAVAHVAATQDAAEVGDRRRAVAATALLLMGDWGPTLAMLRHSKDPQARSFLIHTLGPAGVAPRDLMAPILNVAVDVRRALVLSLGELPEVAWKADPIAAAAIDPMLENLYQNDPDPGVHGAAKWLLRKRGRTDWCDQADIGLSGVRRKGFGWRISETGLTLVTVHLPAPAPAIEVSDCEITVGQFRRIFPNHPCHERTSPGPRSPMNAIDYCQSAIFCNRLSGDEGIADAELAYRLQPNGQSILAFALDDRFGFRLPTDGEFATFSAAGADTPCYYGTSTALLSHYALGGRITDPRLAVARFKPNDLGLFDTIGNVCEWARTSGPERSGANEAALCGGYYAMAETELSGSLRIGPMSSQRIDAGTFTCGFRVVCTVGDRAPGN